MRFTLGSLTIFVFLSLSSLCLSTTVTGQVTMGLIQHGSNSLDDGYVLFAPVSSTMTYLIDKCGNEINSWESEYRPGQAVYLLPNGHLLRTGNAFNPNFVGGGRGGIIEEFNWEGDLVWQYFVSDTSQCQHHDIHPLDNGNLLVVAWEAITREEALAAGRRPNNTGPILWSEKIIELEPLATDSANIVWEWRAWDHLIQEYDPTLNHYDTVALNPGLIHINETGENGVMPDWLHFNGIDYNKELNQILISVHGFNEVWIVDHSTSTFEAANDTGGRYGKGGNLLYRWGNPATYQQGTIEDQKLFGQHHAQWIKAGLADSGKILLFNNGANRPDGNYSTIEIIDPPVEQNGVYSYAEPFLPLEQDWIYGEGLDDPFYSRIISGVQALEEGHFLICSGGDGRFFEIDSNENVVWEYINPVGSQGPAEQGDFPSLNSVFRCTFYPETYAAFENVDLVPSGPIELNPVDSNCQLNTVVANLNPTPTKASQIDIFPNPGNRILSIRTNTPYQRLLIRNSIGQEVLSYQTEMTKLSIQDLPEGLYFLSFYLNESRVITQQLLITR